MQSPKKETAKKTEVKSPLLQTYFTSLLSLVLCVTMFLGTSYAWFTSEVNNSGNEIYVGTLKVGLFKEVPYGSETPTLVDLADNATVTDPATGAESSPKLFDSGIRWEPGYTALETIQIVNQGDLAFKYVLNFTDGTLAAVLSADNQGAEGQSAEGQSAEGQSTEGQSSEGQSAEGQGAAAQRVSLEYVAKYFDVWVFDHSKKKYNAPASYAEIENEVKEENKENGWKKVGTLDEVLAGTTVLSGDMNEVRISAQEASAINAGTTDGVPTSAKYTIALHMQEGAGPEVMGRKISLNVKLVAYQMTSEMDDLAKESEASGSTTYYDDLTPVAGVEELKKALASKQTTILSSDIALLSTSDCITMTGGMLDGNDKTITYGGERVNDSSVGVLTTSGGKISNLTIDGQENGRALYVTKLESNLQVSDCTFDGAYSFNLNSAETNEDAVVSFKDTTFRTWTSYANVARHVYFTDCTFEGNLRPYGDTTLANCDFAIVTDAEGTVVATGTLDLSKLESGEAITLINCTYNGQLIEKAVVTCEEDVLDIIEGDAVEGDAAESGTAEADASESDAAEDDTSASAVLEINADQKVVLKNS